MHIMSDVDSIRLARVDLAIPVKRGGPRHLATRPPRAL